MELQFHPDSAWPSCPSDNTSCKMTMSMEYYWNNTEREEWINTVFETIAHVSSHRVTLPICPSCQLKCRSLIIKFHSTAFKSFVKKKDASSCVASFISPTVRGLVLNILSYRDSPHRKTLHGYKCGDKGSVTTMSLHTQDTVSKMQIV